MSIPVSTELTKFCIFRVAKNYRPPFGAPLLEPGGICPLCPLPAATAPQCESKRSGALPMGNMQQQYYSNTEDEAKGQAI